MERDVNRVIRTLMRKEETRATAGVSPAESRTVLTSFGVPLVRGEDNHLIIDLTNIHVFRNLPTFLQMLIDDVIEQCSFGAADVMVRRKVDPNLTPDLAALNIDWVMIYARLDAAEHLPFYHRQFENRMHLIFRTLQAQRWGGILFPDFFGLETIVPEGGPPALVYPFQLRDPGSDDGQYFLVEYSRSGRLLRITIEDARSPRLQLKHIPHRVVDQTVRESYLPDVYRIAEKIHQGVLREWMNNRAEFTETRAQQQELFRYLQDAGLPDLQMLRFTWPTDDTQLQGTGRRDSPDALNETLSLFVKEMQLLDDPLVLSALAQGNVVEMVAGPVHVFFNLSRYGSCLNASHSQRVSVRALDDYLNAMPALSRAVRQRKGALRGVRLFLIHHITAEVIGLIKAFQDSGCKAMTTFFVKYAGIIPDSYLETLMSLPSDLFGFYGLQKIESRQNLSGRFQLSRLFSPVTRLQDLDEILFREGSGFFEAMRLAAGNLFLREVARVRREGQQILLVEDGGYLAPLINRYCLEGRTVAEVCSRFHLSPPADGEALLFSQWMQGVFPGSVEHTKNGYDYNAEVLDEFGTLAFPVATIAVSSLKRGPEARECAVSILNATENILHRLGALLSARNILVLGSCGAIGGFLKRELSHRLDSGRLFGVDIAVSKREGGTILEAPTLEALGSKIFTRIDMVIGVIGKSIIRGEHLEEMILHGQQKTIYFISGSTKTTEFSDLERYLQSLRNDTQPQIGGNPVTVEFNSLRDLQTGILQAYTVAISFPRDPRRDKTLYLLGGLMPINFLYYGIPGEIIDKIMAQLYTVTCGVIRRQRADTGLPARLLAIDHDIDADANPLFSVTGAPPSA